MHDVACEFACVAVRSKDTQKQLARTSLRGVLGTVFVESSVRKQSPFICGRHKAC